MLNKKLIRIFNLTIISTVLIFTSIYTYFINNTPVIPECSATLRMNMLDKRLNLDGFYIINVIPNKNNLTHYSVAMNGVVNYDGTEYVISRKFLMKYTYQGEHFFSQVENVSIDPSDQAGENIKIRGIPQLGQLYFIKTEQLNDKNYMIKGNLAPHFICTL